MTEIIRRTKLKIIATEVDGNGLGRYKENKWTQRIIKSRPLETKRNMGGRHKDSNRENWDFRFIFFILFGYRFLEAHVVVIKYIYLCLFNTHKKLLFFLCQVMVKRRKRKVQLFIQD